LVVYQALFKPEDDWLIITFPDFGWGVSNGKGEADSLEMACDLLFTMVNHLMKEGADLPVPRNYRSRHYRQISLSAAESAKVELYLEFRKSGLSKAELATRMGLSEITIDRLFSLRHVSRFDHMERAFLALGKRMVLTIQSAA